MKKQQEPWGTFIKQPSGQYVRDGKTIMDPLLAQAMEQMHADYRASQQQDNTGPLTVIGIAKPEAPYERNEEG